MKQLSGLGSNWGLPNNFGRAKTHGRVLLISPPEQTALSHLRLVTLVGPEPDPIPPTTRAARPFDSPISLAHPPKYGMAAFRHWIAAREQLPGLTPSDPNVLVHLIARYSAAGISRRDLGEITKLPPSLLAQLLTTLCGLGQLRADRQGGETVYRAVVGW